LYNFELLLLALIDVLFKLTVDEDNEEDEDMSVLVLQSLFNLLLFVTTTCGKGAELEVDKGATTLARAD
jgi:hypothetical protein